VLFVAERAHYIYLFGEARAQVIDEGASKKRLKQSLISSGLVSIYHILFFRPSLFCRPRMVHFERVESVVTFLGH
jgi:hypothetical protein